MVTNENVRSEFLRRYFDANHEVTVESGKAILLAIKIARDSTQASCDDMEVIGGVVFLLPCYKPGGGWQGSDQDPYDEAYERHQLGRISSEGLARLKRYEDWENKLLHQAVDYCKLPMWNAIFCAISPKYSNLGICSKLYRSAIAIMISYSHKHFAGNQLQIPAEVACKPRSLINNQQKNSNATAPLVLAVSHSDRSARFHQSNGFCSIKLIPYHDQVAQITPFFAHLLAHEPIRGGSLLQFNSAVRETMTSQLVSNETVR